MAETAVAWEDDAGKERQLNLNAFDSHAHLDLEQFDADREEVIQRAREAGVTAINTVGIDLAGSRRAVALAETHEGLVASVGIHPQEAHRAAAEWAELEELAGRSRVVAIGETGLDFHHGDAPREDQIGVFRRQLELASRLDLPVIIHSRQAAEETRTILAEWAAQSPVLGENARGVIHCYSGDLDTALYYINLGFYISVGAYIGYPSSSQFRRVLKSIPLQKLLVETDCPFLPPQKMRGKRNEPAYIPLTLAVLAEIKGQTMEELAEATAANARSLFRRRGRPAHRAG
jgi:TatD DNase family protein